MMVVVLAHWCPHCNNEVPVLLEWEAQGGVPVDLQIVGISTAASADRPNFPPGEWLATNGWDWPVLADDAEQTAARAYGVTAYPFITFIDASGNVVARTTGEIPIADLQELADATVA
jgi:thiol-disulfide isomerase/thioredoxin